LGRTVGVVVRPLGITAFALSGVSGRAVAMIQSEPSLMPVLNRTLPIDE